MQPDLPLEPGKIRDSNRVMLLAALRDRGYQPVDLGIATDTYLHTYIYCFTL